jgi:Thioesterase domain/PEP-CTERM motif
MAAEYVEAVHAIQPRGPYLLGGWSAGGLDLSLEQLSRLCSRANSRNLPTPCSADRGAVQMRRRRLFGPAPLIICAIPMRRLDLTVRMTVDGTTYGGVLYITGTITSITVASVPEPSSLILAGIGWVGVLGYFRARAR